MSQKWIDVKGGAKGKPAATTAVPAKSAAAPKRSPAPPPTAAAAVAAAGAAVQEFSAAGDVTPPPRSPAPENYHHVDPLDMIVPSNVSASLGRTMSGLSQTVEASTHTPRRTPVKYLSEEAHFGPTVDGIRTAAPASPGRELGPITVMTRYKACLHDMVTLLANPAYAKEIGVFLELAEESVRDLKKLKMNAPRAKPKAMSPTPAHAEEDALDTCNTVGSASGKGGKQSWASLLKPTAASLAAVGRSPSKKELSLAQRQQDANTELDRTLTAARNEVRRHEANERRADVAKAEEAKARNAKVAEKVIEAKQRHKEEIEAVREHSNQRMEQAAQRQEELLEAGKDRAMKHAQKVDEVLFVNEMTAQNKAMRIENRNMDAEHAIEARKEEQKQIAKERTEAREAVLERSKELTQQKVDKVKEREQQRLEQMKRLEEQKKSDAESRQAKNGEREKKMLDLKQAAADEAESRKKRAEERILKSQQNREEQRAELAAKRKEKDQKTKERLAEPATKTTVSEVLQKETPAEEEQVNSKLAKASASIARHAKLFIEQYQKECALGIKDLNKSKFRALSTRLIASNGGSMSRQVLNDMNNFLQPVDHEYARYFNLYEPIVNIMVEARKSNDHQTFKLCSDFLHKLLLDSNEGAANARYFVRAGHVVTLLGMIHEEIRTLQKHNRSAALTVCFSLLQCCVQSIVTDATVNVKLAPIRDQLMDLLEVAGVDKFCFAIASTCVDAEDMACLQYALLTLQLQIYLIVKRKQEPSEWYQTATVSLFTLLQNILNPGGVRAKDDAITHNTMLVILSSFRLLNIIARHRSSVIGTLLREQESARMELYHMAGAFFGYVSRNETAVLERIPQDNVTNETTLSKTFEDALTFGMTMQSIPRAPLPAYNADGTNFTPAPSSARSSVSQTSTVQGGSSGKGITRAAIHELLLFMGIAAIGEPKVQEIFSWGKDKPLLQVILTALNINYFNKGKHILFPTVLSIIARDDRNRIIAEREMDVKSLYDFLIGEVQCLPQKQQKKIKASEVPATPGMGPADSPVAPPPISEAKNKIFAFNWADVDSDDEGDDEAPTAAKEDGSAAAAPSAPSSPELVLQAKKDKMLQLVKNYTNYNVFFRIENRIPRAMWSDIGRFLEECASE